MVLGSYPQNFIAGAPVFSTRQLLPETFSKKGEKKRLPQIAARPAAHLASIDAETSWENICFSARQTAGPKVRPSPFSLWRTNCGHHKNHFFVVRARQKWNDGRGTLQTRRQITHAIRDMTHHDQAIGDHDMTL